MEAAEDALALRVRGCIDRAERAGRVGLPRRDVARLYSHALKLVCDLDLAEELFRRCLNGLSSLDLALAPRAPASVSARAVTRPRERDPLEVEAFGPLRVRRGSAEMASATWPGRKTLELFEVLVSYGDTPVAVELAMESLWPEASPEAGRRNLKVTLHRLRHQLEPELGPGARSSYVILNGGLLALDGMHVRSDVVQFDRAMREGRQQEARGELDAAARHYRRAAALYAGPLLGEQRYLDWIGERREARRTQVLRALATLGQAAEAREATKEAVCWYEHYLLVDRCDEGIAQRLMRLYLRLERRSDARRAFLILQEALAEELDVQPAPESRKLYREFR
jgi:LuxR family transcriptional regulator, maltose regulon positive regulatory protein